MKRKIKYTPPPLLSASRFHLVSPRKEALNGTGEIRNFDFQCFCVIISWEPSDVRLKVLY